MLKKFSRIVYLIAIDVTIYSNKMMHHGFWISITFLIMRPTQADLEDCRVWKKIYVHVHWVDFLSPKLQRFPLFSIFLCQSMISLHTVYCWPYQGKCSELSNKQDETLNKCSSVPTAWNAGCFPLCQRFRKFWSEFNWRGPFRFLSTGIFRITPEGGPLIWVGIFRPRFVVTFLINQFFA